MPSNNKTLIEDAIQNGNGPSSSLSCQSAWRYSYFVASLQSTSKHADFSAVCWCLEKGQSDNDLHKEKNPHEENHDDNDDDDQQDLLFVPLLESLWSMLSKIRTVTLLKRSPTRTVSHWPKPGKKSYLSVSGTTPLLGMTVGNLIDQCATRFPDSLAVVVLTPKKIRKNYREMKTEIDHLGAGFLSLGLKKGDRIGIWGPNSYEWCLTFYAAIKCGAVIVNINPANQTRELVYCLNKVGVKFMVIADQFKTSNYYEMMVKVCPEIETSNPGKITTKTAPTLNTVITIPSVKQKGAFTLDEIIQLGSSVESLKGLESTEKEVQFDDIANIQFTSGTTGSPKGVMLSHHNIVNNAYYYSRRFECSEKDRICLTVPLFHCLGCIVGLLTAAHIGAAVVIPSPGFSPAEAVEAISQEKCTMIYGTPTMHSDIINTPGFENNDRSSIRLAVTGGGNCPTELIRQMQEKYTTDKILNGYGLTEASPVFFQPFLDDSPELRTTTVGYPLEHCEVKVVDRQGKVVEIGRRGEMCVRGYMVMRGYWEDPEKTSETIDSARWLHTGDLAIMLEEGYSQIVGRAKDMIIRGGENIYPKEIEDFLLTHPSIQEAQIFSVPDRRTGEEVCAWLKLRNKAEASVEEIKEYCSGAIAHYKIPRYIRFVNDFPKTASGKIQKFKMQEAMLKQLAILNKIK
ncbi:unnamed protein product [Orchesella dallaii]|uniref:Medium-chain acyl-CoA ligase ACSF2, mitochondrial n=1 Tax=Orchesella dallaii TaxID=48710 RepID=A0ABP1QUV1_9HEXA